MIQNAFPVPGTQSVSNKRLLSIEKQNTGVRSVYTIRSEKDLIHHCPGCYLLLSRGICYVLN